MRPRHFLTGFFLAAALVVCAAAGGADRQAMPIGLDVLSDLELLPLLKRGVVCLQHSSYDRTGGNDDGFTGKYTHLRRTDANEFVIFDAAGPGCIYRLWSALPPEGYVKFFFDGETKPRLTCNFREMFQGKVPPFAPPLTGQSSGGWYSYHPMPFAKRCTIVTEKKTGFLAVAYHRFPEATKVETFSTALTGRRKKLYDAIQAHLADPSKREAAAKLEMKWAKLPAGGERTLAELKGPATIRGLHMKVKTRPPAKWGRDMTLRKLVLRMYWDGDARPAIECPVGDFFGTGFGDTKPARGGKPEPLTYAAACFGMTADFHYFRLPMPFRKSARITIENGNARQIDLGWAADVKATPVPEGAAYLHVQWRDHVTKAGAHVPILTTTGRGHYVGTVLSMQSPHWLTYLEGDEKFTVDGERRPSIYGTGTEDYFNCGWYYKTGPVAAPFHGLTAKPDWQSRTSQYRMHVPDCVPFTKSLKVLIEHGEANDRPYTNYAIVAYWYQDSTSHAVQWRLPPARELRFPIMIANDPGRGTFFDGEKWTIFAKLADSLDVEAGLQAGGAAVKVVDYHDLDANWDGPPRLLLAADKPGALLRWQVPCERDGLYRLDLIAPKGPRFGIAELCVDGKPTGYRIDFYARQLRQDVIRCDKPFAMTAGLRWLELRVVGKNEKSTGCGMAPGACILRCADAWPAEWNVVGAFAGGVDYGYSTARPPEKGVDLAAKYARAGGKQVAWTKLKAKDRVWLHPKFKPNSNCVAYAHVYVRSPDERQATALVGADDGAKLFVNGEVVWARPGMNHLKVDECAIPVRLKAGWNEVLIKVCQIGGHWGFAFRLSDPKGELTYATSKSAAKAGK